MERLDRKTLLAVTLTVTFYIGVTAAEGKCSGQWAIHACGGGNGKRAQPVSDDLSDDIRQLAQFKDDLQTTEDADDVIHAASLAGVIPPALPEGYLPPSHSSYDSLLQVVERPRFNRLRRVEGEGESGADGNQLDEQARLLAFIKGRKFRDEQRKPFSWRSLTKRMPTNYVRR